MKFSTKVQIPPSATVTINSIAQQKKLAGERIFNLSAGEPMMNTAQYLEKAVQDAMQNGRTLYPPVAGLLDLREKASQWMNTNYKTNYTAKNTLITCGGKFGIYLSLQALLNDDDEVIIIAPYWVSYPSMVSLFGGKPVIITTEENNQWKIKPEDIQQACTEKTKMLILNNASNPTGTLYTKEELMLILKVAKEKNIIVLSDEVYSGLTYDAKTYTSCASLEKDNDNLIVIQSCSKNFGMTGWRVGFVFGSENLIKMLTKIQGQSITGTSIISQYAAIAAIEQSEKITAEIQQEMQSRRDIFTFTFNELFRANVSQPQSSLYHFIPLSAFGIKNNDDIAFCEQVLTNANIALVPGSAFGCAGYIRTSFGANKNELIDSIQALASHLGFSA